MSAVSLASSSRLLGVVFIALVGGLVAGLAGAALEAEVVEALVNGGVRVVPAARPPWWGVVGAGALAGPLSFGALRAAERLRGRAAPAGRLLRLAWGPAVGLGVGLVGAAYAAARVHLKAALDAAARGEVVGVEVRVDALGLEAWALFGVVGGAVLALAVGLVAGWDEPAAAG